MGISGRGSGGALAGVEKYLTDFLPKILKLGGDLATQLIAGMQKGLDGLQAMILASLAKALTNLGDKLPDILKPLAQKLADAAQGAADANRPADVTLRRLTPEGPQQGGTANTNIPEEAGKFGLAYISALSKTFVSDPRVASDCAIIAYEILNKLGLSIKGTTVQNANVGVLEKNAKASGFKAVDGKEIKPGDLIIWTSGNGKTYGVTSGKHAGVAAGYDAKGNLLVIENPGSAANGQDRRTQVVPIYDRENITAYRGPNSPFTAAPATTNPPPFTGLGGAAGAGAGVNITVPLPTAAEQKEYNFKLADYLKYQKDVLALAGELQKAEEAHNTELAQRVQERIDLYIGENDAKRGAVEFAKKVLADRAALEDVANKKEEETQKRLAEVEARLSVAEKRITSQGRQIHETVYQRDQARIRVEYLELKHNEDPRTVWAPDPPEDVL